MTVFVESSVAIVSNVLYGHTYINPEGNIPMLRNMVNVAGLLDLIYTDQLLRYSIKYTSHLLHKYSYLPFFHNIIYIPR